MPDRAYLPCLNALLLSWVEPQTLHVDHLKSPRVFHLLRSIEAIGYVLPVYVSPKRPIETLRGGKGF